MTYTLKQAAEATGKSKPTILRAIQSGRVSATRDENTQGWLIEPVELHRVYPPISDEERTDTHHLKNEAMKHHVTPENLNETGVLRHEIELLREMLAERERRVADKDATITDLRERLDQEGEERRTAQLKLTALLTDQSQKTALVPIQSTSIETPRRSWLQRLTGTK